MRSMPDGSGRVGIERTSPTTCRYVPLFRSNPSSRENTDSFGCVGASAVPATGRLTYTVIRDGDPRRRQSAQGDQTIPTAARTSIPHLDSDFANLKGVAVPRGDGRLSHRSTRRVAP